MLSNSVIAGALAAAYLTVLVLHLNPTFPLSPRALVPLAITLGLAYGINLTVAFYALIVLRQLTAAEVLSPGWVSVRLLSWLSMMAAGGGAVLMWLNVRAFADVLDAATVDRMTASAAMITTSAAAFLLIALAHIGRRGGGASAAILIATMALSVAAPLAARGRSGPMPLAARPTTSLLAPSASPEGGRVHVIALDGATLDIISPAVAQGRLPNFGRMLDGGAVLHLASLRPTQAEPVWSAAATGRVPLANGVRASALYRVREGDAALSLLPDYCFAQALVRFGFLREEPHDSRAFQARPLWTILSDGGVPVAVVGWPVTHPAPPVNGLLISDVLHTMTEGQLEVEGRAAVSPPERFEAILGAFSWPASPDPVALVSALSQSPDGNTNARHDPLPIAADRVHLQALRRIEEMPPARFVAVRFPGIDAVGHRFLRYADPTPFGDVSEAERRQYGRVLEEYYAFLDTIVGRAIDALAADDLLLVVSGFGMEPLSPGKRVLERIVGNADISGSHERSPDGFLLAFGRAIAPGRPPRGSILDLTPTVLYYLGLPIGRDMEGFARTDLFRPAFTNTRPITFIPTYGR